MCAPFSQIDAKQAQNIPHYGRNSRKHQNRREEVQEHIAHDAKSIECRKRLKGAPAGQGS